jgi:hypothetical protein
MRHASRPTFLEGAGVAAVASLAGGACHAGLSSLYGPDVALRVVVAGLGLAYTVYLVGRAEARVGRIVAIAGWIAAACALWLLAPPFAGYVLAHAGLAWLVRSLYFHASVLTALADLGLVALGAGAAVWSAQRADSVALALWCFFLVQALFASLPAFGAASRGAGAGGRAFAAAPEEDRFRRAHRAAETALSRLRSPL